MYLDLHDFLGPNQFLSGFQRCKITQLPFCKSNCLSLSFTPTSNIMVARSTARATATALLALTTPFVQPPECTDVFLVTDIVTRIGGTTYPETTLRVSVSAPIDPGFASCQPSGWADVVTQNQFQFSPAVCPSGWTAYRVVADGTATSAITRAYCCARCASRCLTPPTSVNSVGAPLRLFSLKADR